MTDAGRTARDDAPSAKDTAVIKTAGRVFEVLEYLREQRRPVSVREVSERLGYPRSSALVLMKSMASLGYLRYDLQRRVYTGTPRLAALGDWVMDAMFHGGRLDALVGQVARDSGETAILAIENDIYAQYVQVILGGGAIQFNVQTGTRRLLAMSGTGWALLAPRGDAEIERLVQKTRARLERGGYDVPLASVMKHIKATRENGYAFSRGAVNKGVGVIAMALPPSDSGERLAIAVGGTVDRLDRGREALVEMMRGCIARHLEPAAARRVRAKVPTA
jgi:DNA-binding IclR family transcriptional regulator